MQNKFKYKILKIQNESFSAELFENGDYFLKYISIFADIGSLY